MQTRHTVAALVFFSAAMVIAQEPLTNEAVVKMVKAGLSEDVIVTMVKTQPAKYALTPDQVIALKSAGVSDKVIGAMVERNAGASVHAMPWAGTPSGATLAAGTASSADPNDPLSPHDSGIYLYVKDRDGSISMISLERAAYQGTKTGGIKDHIPFAPKHARAVIPGAKSGIRTLDSRPEFYFYFEDKAAGLGKTYFGIQNLSNPNQFALVKLELTKTSRQTVIFEVNALGDVQTGTQTNVMIPFKSERLRPGLYKVVPTAGMEPGEYCFLASAPLAGAYGAGTMGAVDIFDFAISENQ